MLSLVCQSSVRIVVPLWGQSISRSFGDGPCSVLRGATFFSADRYAPRIKSAAGLRRKRANLHIVSKRFTRHGAQSFRFNRVASELYLPCDGIIALSVVGLASPTASRVIRVRRVLSHACVASRGARGGAPRSISRQRFRPDNRRRWRRPNGRAASILDRPRLRRSTL